MDRPVSSPNRNNPSRKTCEDMIRRILMAEVLQQGTNTHFRKATDFMEYFESLYPASEALTKQVQRAVKSMDIPKDDRGFFVAGKTSEQLEEDREITKLLKKSASSMSGLEDCEMLHLEVDPSRRSYLASLIAASTTFRGKFVTLMETANGILFFTANKRQLEMLLSNMMGEEEDKETE